MCHQNCWTTPPGNMRGQEIWRQTRRERIDSNMEIPNIELAASGSFAFLTKNNENHQKSWIFIKNLDFRHPQFLTNDKTVDKFGFCVLWNVEFQCSRANLWLCMFWPRILPKNSPEESASHHVDFAPAGLGRLGGAKHSSSTCYIFHFFSFVSFFSFFFHFFIFSFFLIYSIYFH